MTHNKDYAVLFQGLFGEVCAPLIPELIVQTKSDYSHMLSAISMRGGGHIVGGVIGKV